MKMNDIEHWCMHVIHLDALSIFQCPGLQSFIADLVTLHSQKALKICTKYWINTARLLAYIGFCVINLITSLTVLFSACDPISSYWEIWQQYVFIDKWRVTSCSVYCLHHHCYYAWTGFCFVNTCIQYVINACVYMYIVLFVYIPSEHSVAPAMHPQTGYSQLAFSQTNGQLNIDSVYRWNLKCHQSDSGQWSHQTTLKFVFWRLSPIYACCS